MPTNTGLYPITYTICTNNSFARSACPVVASECVDMDFSCIWVNNAEDSYNCNRCGADKPFCMPYVEGDKIHFQTQLTDDLNDVISPLFGWEGDTATAAFRVQLCDSSGAVVSSDVTTFASEYMIAYNGTQSYQALVIDTALIKTNHSLTCWSLRVNSYKAGAVENRVVYSEPYCEIVCDSIQTATVKVKGDFPAYDCCGNYYGRPVIFNGFFASVGNAQIEFDNTQRYTVSFVDEGCTVVKESFQQRNTKSTITKLFELKLNTAIPPYAKNIFCAQHYAAESVYIDDVKYKASGTVDNRLGRSTKMFLFDAEFSNECEQNFKCNG